VETTSETIVLQVIKRLTPVRKPRVLFHYTSTSGLIGILNSRSIWATSIRFLNDSKEYELAIEIARGIIVDRVGKVDNKFDLGLYRVLTDSLVHVSEIDVYASSFTENGDQLSQWRGYCPPANGYSIGFKTASLLPASAGIPNRFLARCTYEPRDHETLISNAINSVVKFAAASHTAYPDNRDRVFRESYKLFGRILPLIAPALKDQTFQEEKEWRLVALGSSFDAVALSFRAGRSMLVPYYEYRVDTQDSTLPISEIIVGPTPHPELSRHAVETMLSKHNVHKVNLSSSGIPYRTW